MNTERHGDRTPDYKHKETQREKTNGDRTPEI